MAGRTTTAAQLRNKLYGNTDKKETDSNWFAKALAALGNSGDTSLPASNLANQTEADRNKIPAVSTSTTQSTTTTATQATSPATVKNTTPATPAITPTSSAPASNNTKKSTASGSKSSSKSSASATQTVEQPQRELVSPFEHDKFNYDGFSYDAFAPYDGFSYDAFAPYDGFSYDAFAPYDGFSYDAYAPSDAVQQAQALLQQQIDAKPGAYQSAWKDQIDEAFNAYHNREDFTYDLNEDALYNQYKDAYIRQGNLASMDTMGQAAALTGGYGNTYAQTAGQMAYQNYLQQLNDIVPQLEQRAYERYDQEGTDLYNKYNALLALENKDYSRYQDELNAYNQQLEYLTGRYDTERNLDYNQYQNDRNMAYDQYQTDRDFAYNQYQNDRNMAYDQHQTDRDFAYNQYQNDRNMAYDQYQTDREFAYDQHQTDRDTAWNQYLMDLENQQAAAELLASKGDYSLLGRIYGLTDDQMDLMSGKKKKRGNGGGGDGLSKSAQDYMDTLQRNLPYAPAGTSPDTWKNVVTEKVLHAVDSGIVTEKEATIIAAKLGLG